MRSIAERAGEVERRLLQAYGEPEVGARTAPLDELILTILSQNTNDENRDRAYTSLRSKFPTWEAVRDADEQAVIAALRPAGLANQKGPRIQCILEEITRQHGTLDLDFLRQWPAQEVRRYLLHFKGVGPKTAAIVMLFSLNLPAFPVDTHIQRVTGRLGLRRPNTSPEQAHEELASLFQAESYKSTHLNLIRHGRLICQARKPLCAHCVLRDLCAYYLSLQKSKRRAGGDGKQLRRQEASHKEKGPSQARE
jgi:endonuclease-3